MVSHLFFYQLVLIALVWLCVMLQWVWPSASVSPSLLRVLYLQLAANSHRLQTG